MTEREDNAFQEVQRAVQNAQYNEVVTLNFGNDGIVSPPSIGDEITLVATLDESNGGIVWKRADISPPICNDSNYGTDVNESKENGEFDEGILRHLRTKKWILPMLHDTKRNNLYDLAIGKACSQAYHRATEMGKTSLQVLDIGSGTGLLGMMAARSLKNNQNLSRHKIEIKVSSLEMASAMARIARQIIEMNKLGDLIEVLPSHSCDSKFILPQRANLCISELLESGLLGEGILPTLRDAWDRHLNPDAIVVPQRARIFAQLVESENYIACYRGPSSKAIGSKISTRLSSTAIGTSSDCSAEERDSLLLNDNVDDGKGYLVPVRADALFKKSDVNALTDPFLALEFDFTSAKTIPSSEGRAVSLSVTPTSSGVAHGVLFWWELDLWDGLTYSTKMSLSKEKSDKNENDENWQDHWQQCLFVFNQIEKNCAKVQKGIPLELMACHTDRSVSFNIPPTSKSNPAKKQKITPSNPITRFSYKRALQLSDLNRYRIYNDAIQAALRKKGSRDTPVLDLSDFSLGAILAATGHQNKQKKNMFGEDDANATNVHSVESCEFGSSPWPLFSSKVAQIGNDLPRKDATFQVWNTRPEMLTRDLLLPFSTDREKDGCDAITDNELERNIGIVVAEPYYEKLQGWSLQEAMNFYYILRGLRNLDESKRFLSKNVIVIPQRAHVMGCAVELNSNMARAYGPLLTSSKGKNDSKNSLNNKNENFTASICGFDHSPINTWGNRQMDKFDMTFYMWQYDYKALTDPFRLGTLEYEGINNALENLEVWRKVPFRSDGLCHGMMVWIEYELAMDSNSKFLSTNSKYNEQVLRMLICPKTVIKDQHIFCYKASFGSCNQYDVETHSFHLRVEPKN